MGVNRKEGPGDERKTFAIGRSHDLAHIINVRSRCLLKKGRGIDLSDNAAAYRKPWKAMAAEGLKPSHDLAAIIDGRSECVRSARDIDRREEADCIEKAVGPSRIAKRS